MKYDTYIYIDFLDYLKWKEIDDRPPEGIKISSSGEKSRKDIVEVFGISQRVLCSDISILTNKCI